MRTTLPQAGYSQDNILSITPRSSKNTIIQGSLKSVNSPQSWQFFDKIYCISLDTRRDRRELAGKEFAKVGLLERVEFIIVEKHANNPEQGIFESHIHCINKGLEDNGQHILIFEDDILFRGYNAEALQEACLFLHDNPEWDAFFLGCITNGSAATEKQTVVQIQYRCLAHAYALNRTVAKRLARATWQGVPFDDLLRQHKSPDFFAIYPMIAFQGQAGSDNRTVAIDRMRRLFGGLPFIQKTNEFYQNHKPLILSAHLLVLLLLAVLTMTFRD